MTAFGAQHGKRNEGNFGSDVTWVSAPQDSTDMHSLGLGLAEAKQLLSLALSDSIISLE